MKLKNLAGWVAIAAIATGLRAADVRFVETTALQVPRLESVVPGGLDVHFLNDNRALMSGAFAWVNDTARSRLVRLNPDNSVDDRYDPDSATLPYWRDGFAVQEDGTIYFVPQTSTGLEREIHRLDPEGRLDPNFRVLAAVDPLDLTGARIWSLTPGREGRILVRGNFRRLGNVPADGVALLHADGSVSLDFTWQLPMTLTKALPLANGRWIVVGDLELNVPVPGGISSTVPADGPRVLIARVHADGSLDTSFAPSVHAGSGWYGPHAFAFDNRGRLVFAQPGPLGSRYSVQLVRLREDGTRDASFAPILPELTDPNQRYWHSSSSVVYLPPSVERIVAAGNGAVMCFANWRDASLRGVVGVTNAGELDASVVPYRGAGTLRWLRRDPDGQWWGELIAPTLSEPDVGLVRLKQDGTVDPTAIVKATGFGHPIHAAALPEGAVLVEGQFDLAGGIPSPGLVIVEADGTVRNNRAPDSLPWRRAALVAVLADGSVLAQEPTPPIAIALEAGVAADELAVSASSPLGRLFPNGLWQTLAPAHEPPFYSGSGWLAGDGRVVVHTPGRYSVDADNFPSDLLRFLPDGTLDDSFRAVDEGGEPFALYVAGPEAGGSGVWGVRRTVGSESLVRLNDAGRVVSSLTLSPRSTYSEFTYAVTGVPGGAVVGGSFQRINQVARPALARIRENGSADRAWGGWLHHGSTVYSVRALGNGLLLAQGSLVSGWGQDTALIFTADGLPLPQQPELWAPSYSSDYWGITPAGDWIAQLELNDSATNGRVRRWQAQDAPAINIVPLSPAIVPGGLLVLGVDWAGVPLMHVTWYRDGVALDPQAGPTYSFVVHPEDDGAVFWAFIELEGGARFFTRPWRLDLAGRGAWLTNASIRALAGSGDSRLILGAILRGTSTGNLLTRALGPALGGLGITRHAGALDSDLKLNGGVRVNPPEYYHYWREQFGFSHPDVITTARDVGAYRPEIGRCTGDDQMLYEQVGAGAHHFHVMPRPTSNSGVTLAELFVVDSAGGFRRLAVSNFSGRAPIESGDGVLIGGFVIDGDRPLRVLARGIGPALANYGIETAATNPRITLYSGTTALLVNDDWSSSVANRDAVQAAQMVTGAFPLAVGSRDAAVVAELPPGAYTVVVQSDDIGDAGRVALVEIYALE